MANVHVSIDTVYPTEVRLSRERIEALGPLACAIAAIRYIREWADRPCGEYSSDRGPWDVGEAISMMVVLQHDEGLVPRLMAEDAINNGEVDATTERLAKECESRFDDIPF
mgnify:CR=1 FL=1